MWFFGNIIPQRTIIILKTSPEYPPWTCSVFMGRKVETFRLVPGGEEESSSLRAGRDVMLSEISVGQGNEVSNMSFCSIRRWNV